MSSPKQNRRPDLELLETPQSAELIAPLLLPLIRSAKSAGKLYYQKAVTVTASQRERAAGAAPTRTEIGSDNLDFATLEKIKRYFFDERTVEDKGGIEVCDRVGGQAAKMSVLQDRELDAATLILTAGTATAAGNDVDIIRLVKTKKPALLPYAGKLALVLGQTAYDNLMDRPEIRARLSLMTSVTPADNEQVAALDKKLLAMVLKVDEVLVGADKYWGATVTVNSASVDLSQRAALLKIAPDREESENLDPVFAKTVVYQPGDTDFEVRSFYDSGDLTYNYDAIQNVKTVVFNPAACAVFSGIVEPDDPVTNVRVVNPESEPVNTKSVTP